MSAVGDQQPARALDQALRGIAARYGMRTADLVAVQLEYLTMLATPGARDDIADKMAIIQDAKRLAMTANGGKGMCIVTPVQGNREGFDDAGEHDGAWSTNGIAKYSELDKSLDNCFYVYFDDEMNGQNRMKMGSCKTRRGFNIPSTMVLVDSKSGQVLNGADKGVRTVAPGALVQILREDTPILWRRQVYAARTEFQTAGAAWPLRLRRPKANWSLRIRRSSSMPAIVVAAQAKFLKPSMGLVLDLIPR